MRPLFLALSTSLLFTQPASACANAMEDGSLNDQQKTLVVACLLGVMFFIGLYLFSQSKARAAERGERFKDLDGEA